jgi:short-subunit dehydrogenase
MHALPARGLLALLLALTLGACASLGPHRLSTAENRQLAGRTYVVVGASSGFGRGTAVRLGHGGANVVLAARRAEVLEEVAAEVRRGGGQALVVPTDVGRPEQVEALATAATQRFGRIDVWMNIAGVGALGRFWDIPVADYSRMIDTNLKGVVYGTHAALRRFVPQGFGHVVNMSSVEGEVPLAYHTVYAATKAGVLSIGRSLNQELRHAGVGRRVTVSTVMPYANDTPFFGHQANYTGHAHRMILLDDPRIVANALVWVSLNPREELPVGWKAQGAVTAHRIVPDLVERVSANIHRAEIAKGTPVPPTTGAVHQPLPRGDGRGVEGGVRQRMKQEDARRRARGPR